MEVQLNESDRAMLSGERGPALGLAMRLVVRTAEAMGAERLLDVTRAHIDGCLYHGLAGLDYAERLRDGGGRVAVPATLNVSSLDLLHPELFKGPPRTAELARRLMTAYEEMGCRPTWTCAPYQLPDRPGFGEQIAWAESNAIVFANSVLGARTHRYGDFIDIAAALTGRVPAAGLHLDEGRRGEIVFRLGHLPDTLLAEDVLYPVLGHFVGLHAGQAVPVLDGLPHDPGEDRLKALGAAAASSGSVAMFHAVGVTPEAPTLDDALAGRPPRVVIDVTPEQIVAARDSLTTAEHGPLRAISIGAPHVSIGELAALVDRLEDFEPAPGVEVYVNTSRDVMAAGDPSWPETLERAGIQVVVDTCTYITPIIRRMDGVVMTDSAKWAYYAPGNLGVEVAFGSVGECLASAQAGRVVRDGRLWHGL